MADRNPNDSPSASPPQASLAAPALAALFATLISVGAYIAVPLPISPVPIVLQNMFIILAALVLGPRWSLVSVTLYLLLGALGLPVFSGGSGGLARFAGPTGGYLLGYLPATVVAGLIAKLGRPSWYRNLAAGIAGMAVVYLVGVLRLKAVLDADWGRALAAGLLPFIPGDALKLALAAPLAMRISRGIEDLSGRGADV
jgi:biotin transport system substrate-specific component